LLTAKLGLATTQAPSPEVLSMYRTVATHYIGLGSLHPMKTHKAFYKQMFRVLQNVKKEVDEDLPRALHLDMMQVEAIYKDNLLL